jgi:hypothetical protein
MMARRPAKPRRSKAGQNIVNNTPAFGWRLATKREKLKLDVNPNEPRYVRKGVRVRKNDTINLTRDEFTKKAFGLHRRKLAEARATEEGAAHPRYGYKRPLTQKLRALFNENRRLKLVRDARRAYERRGSSLAAAMASARGTHTKPTKRWPEGRPKVPWTNFKSQLDEAIGPDTAAAIAGRELRGAKTRIEDGNWHAMIDALKDQEGESSPLVKLLRSSGRFVEGGVWVTDTE